MLRKSGVLEEAWRYFDARYAKAILILTVAK